MHRIRAGTADALWLGGNVTQSELGRDARWCPSDWYYQFIPVQLGSVVANGRAVVNSACFSRIDVALVADNRGGTLELHASGARQSGCSDYLMLANLERVHFHALRGEGAFKIDFTHWTQREYDDIVRHGMHIFNLPCGEVGTIQSLYRTLQLFDSHDLASVNVEFLQRVLNWTTEPFGKEQQLSPSLIRSGDYFAVMRLDGLDPVIMYGIGGFTGHSCMAAWEGSQLYVVESTDKNPFGPVYWPPPYGIIRTPYERWIALAAKAGYHVNVLPLNRNLSGRFDEAAFWQFFRTVQGMPYGYHNMLYSFLDTYPQRNLPQPITDDLYAVALTALGRLLPNSTEGISVFSMFIAALNHRLGVSCGDMPCIIDVLDARNMTLMQATAMAEQDDWYYDRTNRSMVCSCFVAESWRHALGDALPTLQGTEQTPKDNYQMAVFQPDYFNATNCPIGLTRTPRGTYCQLMYVSAHRSAGRRRNWPWGR